MNTLVSAFDDRAQLTVRSLRELSHWREGIREQLGHSVHEIVGCPCPLRCGRLVADVVFHARSLGRQQHQVPATLTQYPELVELDAFPDLVVGYLRLRRRRKRRIIECGQLIDAEPLLFGGCGGVVAVDVDDHRPASW
jgi:hypothetical protein